MSKDTQLQKSAENCSTTFFAICFSTSNINEREREIYIYREREKRERERERERERGEVAPALDTLRLEVSLRGMRDLQP